MPHHDRRQTSVSQGPAQAGRRQFIKTSINLATVAAAGAAGRPAVAAVNQTADMVLTGARVLTLDGRDQIAEAVAIKGERILAVGSGQKVGRHLGRHTKQIDLKGRVVTPGLIDTHAHLPFFGLRENGFLLNIQGITDRDKVLAVISDRVKRTEDGGWVHAWGLESMSLRYFDRDALDRVSRRHPILVVHTGGQWAFANSMALEMARIGQKTASPRGSRIVKDFQGKPIGLLIHYPAINLVRRLCMRLNQDQIRQAIMFAANLYAKEGVTTVHDNFIHVMRAGVIRAYGHLADAGRLPLRLKMYAYLPNLAAAAVSAGLTFPQAKVPPSQVNQALNYVGRRFGNPNRVRRWFEMGLPYFKKYHRPLFDKMWGGYKMAVDGGGVTSMWYKKPGLSLHRPDHLTLMADICHRAGQQMSVHAGGDQAVDIILGAFEAALKKRPRPDHRHRIEHAIRPTDEAFGRVARLGVVVCTHPQWLWAWGDKFSRIESPMSASGGKSPIPLKTFMNNHVGLCFGADPPAHPEYRPQVALWQASARISPKNHAFDRSEAISTAQALNIQTRGGAFAAFEENDKGSIETGKLADLVVWDVDFTRAKSESVRKARCLMTIVGGRVVHPG